MPSLSIHFSSRESNNAYNLPLNITLMNFKSLGIVRYFYNQLNKYAGVPLHLFHESLKTINSFLLFLTLRSETRNQLLSHRGFKQEVFTVVIYNAIPDLGLLGSN